MKIEKILSGLRQTQDTTKEASASASTTVPKTGSESPRDTLVGALNTALSAAPAAAEKTANEKSNPVTDVMKVAEELAATEQEANIKHAQVMGAAFADAFVARLGTWQTKAAELNQQLPAPAAAPTPTAGRTSFAKMAQENPGLVSQAENLGFQQTTAALEKQANDAFVAGYNDTVEMIHKTASVEFVKGAQIMSKVLDAALQG